MKRILKIKNSPRCPECGSSDCSVTAFGWHCNSCGENFIPDGWLDDLEDVGEEIVKGIRRIHKVVKKNIPQPKGKGKDIQKLLSGAGALLKTFSRKAPEAIFKFFI